MFTPFILFLLFIWIFFFKNNFYSIRLSPNSNDILKNSKVIKKINYNFILKWNILLYSVFLINFFFIKIDINLMWFSHFKLNNFNTNLSIVLMFIFFFIFFFISFYKNINLNFSVDYFISIFNFLIFLIFLYYSNNMYSFIFILELCSLLVLYKFVVSNYWNFEKKKNILNNSNSKQFINMMFFQYWANFFSSILIFFTIFNLNLLFGSLEWFFINFIIKINFNVLYFKWEFFYLILFIFFLGFFLKIGFTPFHLFKLEVYKGLPFFSIFFYTSFYFFSFFLFFVLLVFVYFNSLKFIIYYIFIFFIVFGGIYLLILLFDVNLTKIFFAYSTIINLLNFMILLISY